MYVRQLSPMTPRQVRDRETGDWLEWWESISEPYSRIMALIPPDSSDPRVVAYREELLGSVIRLDYPKLYDEVSLALMVAPTMQDYLAMPIRLRAKLTAYHHVKNMVSVVERHRKLQRDKAKQNNNGKANT